MARAGASGYPKCYRCSPLPGRTPLADLRVNAADALARLDRSEDAERLLNAELTAFPANARARAALQTLYRASGRTREAAALAKR